MKNIKVSAWIFACFLLVGVWCFGPVVEARAESSGLIETVSAKKALNGRWVRNRRGYRFRLSGSKKYARSSWQRIRGKIYCFDRYGYRITGMKIYKNRRYYLNSRGVLTTGWVKRSGKQYYFSKKRGDAIIGWANISRKRYYFNKRGVLLKNRWVGDYYVGSRGYMLRNTWVGQYYLGADGKVTKDIPQTTQKSKVIFVGDSRTVGMKSAVSSNAVFIGKVSQGYSWLKGTASASLQKQLKQYPAAKVVFNMGVNDLGNVNSYIRWYRSFMKQYPSAQFYFLSVNPVEEGLARRIGYNVGAVNNKAINTFNKRIKAAFPSQYLDSCTYLLKNNYMASGGKGTTDGIHYKAATYRAIYQFAIDNMK